MRKCSMIFQTWLALSRSQLCPLRNIPVTCPCVPCLRPTDEQAVSAGSRRFCFRCFPCSVLWSETSGEAHQAAPLSSSLMRMIIPRNNLWQCPFSVTWGGNAMPRGTQYEELIFTLSQVALGTGENKTTVFLRFLSPWMQLVTLLIHSLSASVFRVLWECLPANVILKVKMKTFWECSADSAVVRPSAVESAFSSGSAHSTPAGSEWPAPAWVPLHVACHPEPSEKEPPRPHRCHLPLGCAILQAKRKRRPIARNSQRLSESLLQGRVEVTHFPLGHVHGAHAQVPLQETLWVLMQGVDINLFAQGSVCRNQRKISHL